MTDSVVAGYIHPGTVRAEFCASLLNLVTKGPVPVETVLAYQSGPNISTGRNQLVNSFLTEYTAPWLLMLDTDMVFGEDTAQRLIGAADPVERPVVGALCFSQNHAGGAGKPFPTMYDLTEPEPGRLAFARRSEWPENECVPVSATGAACLLMHRDALELVGKTSKDTAAPWFRELPVGAPLSLMGEDLTFCLRCAAAGIPVHVHTGVQVGHMKTVMLGNIA
jgi:GT2 family glycosyltransferase